MAQTWIGSDQIKRRAFTNEEALPLNTWGDADSIYIREETRSRLDKFLGFDLSSKAAEYTQKEEDR